MARIKQLPIHEAQKIAAGEVVERPANAVKELIENALDAGASSITIYIEEAGKSFIRVIDDGCGMSAEDAQLCFAHHATSKLTTVADLPTLTTFGFRGEALSSIAAVSTVTLVTKEAESQQGIQLILEAAMLQKKSAITCNNGTDISIANLFFNVPARKKFLKTRETELRQISQLFQAFCLDYLSVHFKLYSDNFLLHNCPPVSSLEQRIAQLWDHSVAEHMLITEFSDTKKDLSIHGLISNHMYARYDRQTIFFFVNKRWVKNPSLSKALLRGYMNVLQPDRYPAGCLFLTINPATIDINIHPRKEEIQFLNPKVIEKCVQEMVKNTLQNHLSISLNRKVEIAQSESSFQSARKIQTYTYSPPQTENNQLPPLRYENIFSQILPEKSQRKNEYQSNAPAIQQTFTQTSEEKKVESYYQIVGQFKKTYILLEQDDGLFIVDQHAAHERILYELFTKKFDEVALTKLLFPQIITFSDTEFAILGSHLSFFKSHHIELEIFGTNQIIIQSIPSYLKEVPLEPLLKEAISAIIEYQQEDEQNFNKKMTEKLHAQMACKAAVKAGDILSDMQMHQLLEDLFAIENRFTCPHGRPTGWAISTYEIEKKFKRKQ
jgi:DNA mismatch repair protein MutL